MGEICAVVVEEKVSAHGLEMSNPEPPGGLASGFMNTSAQVGTALGLAALLKCGVRSRGAGGKLQVSVPGRRGRRITRRGLRAVLLPPGKKS